MARLRPPSFSDNMKGMWRSLRSGTGMNPIQTQRHIKQAQRERLGVESEPSRRGGWFSKSDGRDGSIHQMIDKNGFPTSSYPHVHIIHDEPGNEVRILASRGPSDKPYTETLRGSASGNEVEAAIARAQQYL